LVDCRNVDWQDRVHFYRLAAKKMREILVDYARKKRLQKMGGDVQIVPIQRDVPLPVKADSQIDLILLDEALQKFAALDPRKAEIVELRYFGGLRIEEIAKLLGISVSTVHLHLQLAKAWLLREIQEGHTS